MARQNINTGTTANDGTGDSLRNAGGKINDNFKELYGMLGESDQVSQYLVIDSDAVIFNGDSINVYTTRLEVVDPTQNNTITLPDSSGNVVLDTGMQTLTRKSLDSAQLKLPAFKDADESHNYEIVPGALTANQKVFIPDLADSDSFVLLKVAQTMENKTLDSATINNPVLNRILDTNGAEITEYTAVASAVNHVKITNAAATNDPKIEAAGADSSVNLKLAGKGTEGAVEIDHTLAMAHQTMTGAGAVNRQVPLTIFNSGSALAATLADGEQIGEIKYFVNQGAGTATLTPTNLASGSTVAWTQHDAGFMIWGGTSWYLASKTQA